MYGNRVVVTGLGAMTPIGLSADEYWLNLKAGVSGVARISAFDADLYPVKIAAEVKGFDPAAYMDRKVARRVARFAQLSIAAAGQALRDADFTVDASNAWNVGAIIATGGGGIGEVATETETLMARGWERVGPMMVPLMIANMASCQVSMAYGIKGPVVTNTAACAAGVYALFEALHFLRRGDADVIVTGGTESALLPLAFISLSRTGALSRRNEEPEKASRPFDKDRDGFVFGEGAGILVLETLDHAQRRGAHILAELAGASITADAYHVSAPEPSGESARRAIVKAIADADLRPEDIDYVCAHGTGTPLNDASETRALKMALGDHARRIPTSSVKSMVGHLLGAAGAMSAVASVKALQEGIVPPTINLDTPDPECDLDYVPWQSRAAPIRTAMLNGFGFGGQNSVAVLKKWEGS